jgi:26S proteasome regulatory subunit N7
MKSVSTGQLLDVKLRKIRLGFAWMDTDLIKQSIKEAEKLLELGGDWDRRNRLKVYRGLFSMVCRDFKAASTDLLSAVATFTSTELCSYETFIFYAVMTSVVALDRVEFKKKVIDSPEVTAVVRENQVMNAFLHSLHDCKYKVFFSSLVHLNTSICTDRFLSLHSNWFFREVRVLAYAQFLESYKSVTLKSMADSCGISVVFLENELAHFISSRRINAKIDKVAGILESCQPNQINAKYQAVIKQGDLLLNRAQLLSRAINV